MFENGLKKTVVILLCAMMTLLMMSVMVNIRALAQPELYWKPAYPDYVPSGMPDFDQKQDNWQGFFGRWTYSGPVAEANSLWWLDSKFEPGATPPPMVSDGFNLVSAYGSWDDHDVRNVEPLVNDLAAYMGTSLVTGTEVHAMKQGIDNYLNDKGMHAYFYSHLYQRPTFSEVEVEVEKSQDVVLLLGFWQFDQGTQTWFRFGGHYVTVAGINSTTQMIALSDPYFDAAELPPHGVGMPGEVLPPGPHPHPPAPPDSVHNDTLYVSHDIYQAVMPSPSPGGLWGLPSYNPLDLQTLFFNFEAQNFPVEFMSQAHSYVSQQPVFTEVEYAVVVSPWYAKGQYKDYAPSGMPDFNQKQDNFMTQWQPNPGSWTYSGPTAVSNSLWWFDSKWEPNPVPPPVINDGFGLVTSYNPGVWDDHDPQNVQPLIRDLAWYMDTDGVRTGLAHSGTDVYDMQAGIAQYISDKGVNPLGDASGDGVVDITDANIVAAAFGSVPGMATWDLRADVVHDNIINANDMILVGQHQGEKWGKFYEKTQQMPDPVYLEHQINMSEDVVLMLGFWEEVQPQVYQRIGGHYVTAHGIDRADMVIAVSDPFLDNAENGGQGRVIPTPPHGHPAVPPDTVHNNATYVSHDYYTLSLSPSPGGTWGLSDYNYSSSLLSNIYYQNFNKNFTGPRGQWMGGRVYVELEFAAVVSCRGPVVAAGSDDGNVYTLDNMGNLLWAYNTGERVVSVAMSERAEYIVAGSFMNGLFVFNTAGTLLWSRPLPITESYDGDWRGADSKTVGISADGSYIIAATMTGLYLYDNLGTLIWNFMGTTGPTETIARISPDGRNIVAADYNTGEIHFFSHLRDGMAGWSAADGTPVWTNLIGGGFNWAAIDGCGRYAAFTGNVDGDLMQEVYLFDRSGALRWSFELNRAGFARVDMPWDGRSVVAVNADPADVDGGQLVYFSDMMDGLMGWGIGDGTPQWVFTPSPDGGTNDFYSVAISPNGDVISTGPASTNIYLLSNTGAPLQTIANGVVNSLDLTFTGEYGVAGDRVEPVLTGTIRYFSSARNMLLWSFATPGKINSVAIQKKYPCMEPFPYHDIDVSNVTRYTTPDGKVKTYVSQGYPANDVSVTLSNHGSFTETVEVTLYAYSSSNNTMVVVGNMTVTILAGTYPVINMTWNSTNVPYYGNYTLYATIGPVRNENNLTDNEFIDSGLVITGVGDVNGDRKVDIKDVSLAAKGFGTVPGNPLYNPNADINCDYKIDIKDVSIAAKNFGKVYL